MNGYIEGISPDSFSGEIFALEGIAHALVVLNGPTGCKFYHSATSDNQTIRQLEFDPLNFPAIWYFGQPRVPCTYLDNGDYVYGSEEKLVEALEFCRDNVPCDLVAVVNSPGAALIGDDLRGIARRVLGGDVPLVVMETPGFSEDVCIGHENAAIAILDQLMGDAHSRHRHPEPLTCHPGPITCHPGPINCHPERSEGSPAAESNPSSCHPGPLICHPERSEGSPAATVDSQTSPTGFEPSDPPRRPRVNVLGLSLFHRNHTGDVEEVRRLLDLCGIDVNCFVCAGGTLDEHLAVGGADLSIVIHPEYGLRTAAWIEGRFDVPTYVCDGPPVGFSATEEMVSRVCAALGADPEPAFEEGRRARARAYAFISRVHSLTGLPKGVPYAIEGTYGELRAYISFLTRYFGMVPVAARALCPKSDACADGLKALLADLGAPGCLGASFEEAEADLFFGSGNTISALRLAGRRFSGVETMLPTLGYYDVIPKTHLGFSGALLLTELVLNGLLY